MLILNHLCLGETDVQLSISNEVILSHEIKMLILNHLWFG